MYKYTRRTPKGYMTLSDPEEPLKEWDTQQCVHCNAHFRIIPYNEYGFCRNCMGPTCGKIACDVCIPFEKKLDLYEKGKLSSL